MSLSTSSLACIEAVLLNAMSPPIHEATLNQVNFIKSFNSLANRKSFKSGKEESVVLETQTDQIDCWRCRDGNRLSSYQKKANTRLREKLFSRNLFNSSAIDNENLWKFQFHFTCWLFSFSLVVLWRSQITLPYYLFALHWRCCCSSCIKRLSFFQWKGEKKVTTHMLGLIWCIIV